MLQDNKKFDITAVGEILIDLTQNGLNEQGIPVFTANPGGAPANVLVAAARLTGAATAFIGKVGSDSFGSQLRSTLQENHIDVSGLATDGEYPTTLAVVSVDRSGERSFSFYRNPSADVNLRREDLSEQLLKDTRFLHFGSVSLTAEPSRGATLYAVETAKKNGAFISYDPNYRANLWPDEKTAVRHMLAPLPMVDVLKVSEEELYLLTGTDDPETGSAMLAEKGVSLIFVTLGAKGAFYRFGSLTGFSAGIARKVADTNGAGDTFFGAVLGQLRWFDTLEDLNAQELQRIADVANEAASITVSRPGAIPAMPTYEELIRARSEK